VPSLLKFARCCRATLAAADAPFAWQHTPPVWVRLQQPDHTEAAAAVAMLESRLLRHAGVAVQWPGPAVDYGWQRPVEKEELSCITGLPRLRIIDARQRQLREGPLAALLHHECVVHLHTLLLHESSVGALDDASVLLVAERLPRLRTLSLSVTDTMGRADCWRDPSLEPLSRLSQLTALRLHAIGGSEVRGLQLLTQLHTLQLHEHSYGTWIAALSTPALRSLRQLDLSEVGSISDSASVEEEQQAFDALFANLSGLERLTLRRCRFVRLMMPAVTARCAALRLLQVEPVELHRGSDSLGSHCCVPELAQLQSFLFARPQCVLALRLQTMQASLRRAGFVDAALPNWTRVEAQWATLRHRPQVQYIEHEAVGELPSLQQH